MTKQTIVKKLENIEELELLRPLLDGSQEIDVVQLTIQQRTRTEKVRAVYVGLWPSEDCKSGTYQFIELNPDRTQVNRERLYLVPYTEKLEIGNDGDLIIPQGGVSIDDFPPQHDFELIMNKAGLTE